MPSGRWLNHFFEICEAVAKMSEDNSSGIGCVITKDRVILATGYNGHPRGVKHRDFVSGDPEKYLYTEHAERNAIYNAARIGVSLVGAELYVLGRPCADCARGIIQSGIRRVYIKTEYQLHKRWKASCDAALIMMGEADIEIILGK